MPTTFQAVSVVVVTLLPGALYTWAFERIVGRWGVALSDRLLRFVGASAVLHAVLAPATYWFWATQWPHVADTNDPSWWLWLLALAYVALPFTVGTAVGIGTRRERSWATLVTGPDPAPRAWDFLFQGERDGWVRLRLKTGSWVGGAYASSSSGLKSYSAGYPEQQDILLAVVADVDPDSGEFHRDKKGSIVFLDGALLVRWDEVEYLQFIEA